MTGKTLYPTQKKANNTGERMASTYSSSQTISIYTSDSFIGREEVENRKATRGMTDWVAKNFELLDLGEAPYESRQVDSLTRARWQQFTMETLERWIAPHATRHVIRRTLDGRDGPMFMMFPHPEDALGMNLQGRNGELPCALFYLTEAGAIRVFNFRSERISHVEPTDLVATVAFY
jgi:hypothetical protein